MKTTMQEWDDWLRRRYRCYIRKQWKRLRTRAKGATVILEASYPASKFAMNGLTVSKEL